MGVIGEKAASVATVPLTQIKLMLKIKIMAMKLLVGYHHHHHHPRLQAQQAVPQPETDHRRTLFLTPMIFLAI